MTDGEEIPLEDFSKIVESIYDCALNPNCWKDTIGMIAELCRSQYCALGLIDLENAHQKLSFQVGVDGHYQRLIEDKFGAMNPYVAP